MKTLALRIREDDVRFLQSIYPNQHDKFADYFHEILQRYFPTGADSDLKNSGDDYNLSTGVNHDIVSDMTPEWATEIKDMLHQVIDTVSENNDRLFGRNGVAMYGDAKKVKPPIEFEFDEMGYMIKPAYITREEMKYLRLHPKDLERTDNYLRKFLSMSEEDIEIFNGMCKRISLEEDDF